VEQVYQLLRQPAVALVVIILALVQVFQVVLAAAVVTLAHTQEVRLYLQLKVLQAVQHQGHSAAQAAVVQVQLELIPRVILALMAVTVSLQASQVHQ
jgi:hypothetical protein